jgi:predicted amidohydrolase YtcJ
LVLLNGKIFTSVAAHPYVQALAIRGERITATGDSAKIRALAGPHTKQIDLGGRTVIPGINDAHNHLGISPPNRIDLVAPNNPVILYTFTSHAWIVNSTALTRIGIPENQPDPLGGRYERSPDGRLTGVIREYALETVWRNLSDQTSEADALRELRETFSAAVKWGITTIQDMENDMPPDRCVALLEKMPTPIRVRVIRMPGTTPAGRDIQEGRPVPRSSNPLITVSGTKWLLDGTPLEGTLAPATIRQPWSTSFCTSK